MTFSVEYIRQNLEEFDSSMRNRGFSDITSTEVIELDNQRKKIITKLEEAQSRRNAISKEIMSAKRSGNDASKELAESEEIKKDIAESDIKLKEIEEALSGKLLLIPNVLNEDTPIGEDEKDNTEIQKWSSSREPITEQLLGFLPKQHFEIGEAKDIIDFESAIKISGSRFSLLKGKGAKLSRILSNFMLDCNTEAGFLEVEPPLLVKSDTCIGTGQLPKFEKDIFKTTDGLYLIPTSEAPLTNLVAQKITNREELPLRLTSLTPCFRSEAGAAGRDTRGLIRQHQFYKVELVSIVPEEDSVAEHEMMLEVVTGILQKLELSYRVVSLCSGDIGFCAKKTYDIEVWFPAQGTYREVSSISNNGDFQSRRMKARYREKALAGEKKGKIKYPHTLNGSSLAVGRIFAAILENYQKQDGTIAIPKVLQEAMKCEVI